MTDVALEASRNKMSTLPTKRRVAISVTVKKEICRRRADNPKRPSLNCPNLLVIALVY